MQARLGVLEKKQADGFDTRLKVSTGLAVQEENLRRREAGEHLREPRGRRLECSEGAAKAFKARIGECPRDGRSAGEAGASWR